MHLASQFSVPSYHVRGRWTVYTVNVIGRHKIPKVGNFFRGNVLVIVASLSVITEAMCVLESYI